MILLSLYVYIYLNKLDNMIIRVSYSHSTLCSKETCLQLTFILL